MRLPRVVTRKFGRSILKFKKDSPHIFFVAGVVGTVASTVMACRATMKLSGTLDEIQGDMAGLKNLKSNVVSHSANLQRVDPELNRIIYGSDDYYRDAILIYTTSAWKIAKLYGPSVILSVASITSLTGSHIQLTRRNAALMAAYAAVQQAFDDYRERVRDTIGEDNERDFYLGINEYKVIKDEDGKDKTLVASVDMNKKSVYARIFDEYSNYWEKDPELNLMFVRCQQNYANDLLHSRGHIFLNEVYDMLGIDRSKAGQIVGWVRGNGDDHVDFGIYDAHNGPFVNGWERSVLLDFNVDGVIYDKI